MDDNNEQLERLKKALADAKRVQSELNQSIADMDKILAEIKSTTFVKPKRKKS